MNIRKMAHRTGLSAHTLRYYEKIGLLVNIDRDARGYRDFSEQDVIWVEFIKRLKATNMPLDEIKRFADLRSRGDVTIPERLEILENHQKRVARQMQALSRHQQKIKEKIAIVMHTDCGCSLAFDKIDMIAANMEKSLGTKKMAEVKSILGKPFRENLRTWLHAFQNPWEAVQEEVAAVRRSPFVPDALIVHGLVYDLETGGIEIVVDGYEA